MLRIQNNKEDIRIKRLWDRIAPAIIVMISCGSLGFAQEPGSLLWKSSTGWYVHAVAPSGDIDGDEIADLFVGSGNDLIHCFSGGGVNKGGTIWSMDVGGDVWTVASLSDVNGDGVDDCLAGAADNTIYCASGRGTMGLTSILWSYPVGGDVWSVAKIKDLNGDGINDCLAGTGDDKVYCLCGAQGSLLWSFTAGSDIQTVHSISDVSGDGKDDCIAGGNDDRVLCISGGSSGKGDLIWYYTTGSTVLSVAPIEDVNGDGTTDCLAGSEDNKIYCISGKSSAKATLLWSYTTGSTVKTVSAITDVNGDGISDCLAGSYDNKIYCISGKNGKLLWSYITGSTVLSVASISDVNGTGGEDCIGGGEDNNVYCIEGKSGQVIWSSPLVGSVKCVASISDLSGNGIDDVLSGSDDSYVYAFEGGYSQAKDVGITNEIEPTDSVFVDTRYFPIVTVTNFTQGTTETFPCTLIIEDTDAKVIYSAEFVVDGLGPGEERDIIFDGWVVPPEVGEWYTLYATSYLPYDNNSHNDTWEWAVKSIPKSDLDVGVLKINTPSSVKTGVSIKPDATVQNYGKLVASFNVICQIQPSGSWQVYEDTAEVLALTSDDTAKVIFKDWTPDAGSYIMWVKTFLIGDMNAANDSTLKIVNAVGIEEAEIPIKFDLSCIKPNPMSNQTVISYQLPVASKVSLGIYDISGKRVKILVAGALVSGRYSVIWNGKDKANKTVPAGIYFIRLETPDYKGTRKLVLLTR